MKKGDKTMRRHVENPERESLGILALFLLWVLALMLLSVCARGQEKQEQKPAPALPEQKKSGAKQVDKKAAKAAEAPAVSEEEEGEQVTLSRFILISIPDRQLALVDEGKVVKTYPIAVGANGSPSPKGDFTIISRVSNPSWTHKGQVVPPGKNNPVGSRWMGLSLKGYGIHGTNAPRSIGKAASHGCFRMGKKDIEELFTLVRVGDTVAVRGERDDLVTQVFGAASGEVQVASATVASADGGADEE